ncbi:hypothetical protein ACFX2I_044572 [Malus domestica]
MFGVVHPSFHLSICTANQMQERKVGGWPFLYSSENRNQYWMAVIVRADYPVQNQPAELGELGRKCWYLLDRQPC